ncbi:MAG: DUF177 domain-containing protein [Intestinibacillus sp.]
MKINLKKLLSGAAGRIPFEGTADLRAEELYGAHPFPYPVCYRGEITSHLDVLRLTGEIETTYVTACARCLKPLGIPLSAEVDMVLIQNEDGQEETEDVFMIEGDEVDPEDVLIPALYFEINMAYLCKEDCKGLCPHCGADRNVTACDCSDHQIDDRLAVLKTLLDKKQDNAN